MGTAPGAGHVLPTVDRLTQLVVSLLGSEFVLVSMRILSQEMIAGTAGYAAMLAVLVIFMEFPLN